ncbi:hypothetical protein B0H10DRAFT_2203562 [Mycena sp. CBHHK59/15]|nr:hypothetical protein B0H10DRAFT_2203562 [Mycena sp. CBHHK59/15]
MVVTRASSSPRTSPRSRSSRSSGASSCSSSSSAPPAALSSASARRRRLEAKHTQLYPTTARLGIRGTKAVKRRIVQRRILEKLELFSHRLTAMRLRSGYTQNDRWFAGSYHQVYSYGSIPLALALACARALPSGLPSPVPAPLPADPAAKEAELPIPPHTPMRQTLHFHYGGYGGVDAHYSLRGKFWFLTPTPTTPLETSSTRPPSHRNRSRRVHTCAFDRLVPDTSCTNTICTMVYPRAKEDENPFTACIIANLVLQDFLDSWKPGVFLMALRSSASSTPPVTGSLLAG